MGIQYFREYCEDGETGATTQMLSNAAKENHCWIVGGSFPELDGNKVYNTCQIFDDHGNLVAKHRKVNF